MSTAQVSTPRAARAPDSAWIVVPLEPDEPWITIATAPGRGAAGGIVAEAERGAVAGLKPLDGRQGAEIDVPRASEIEASSGGRRSGVAISRGQHQGNDADWRAEAPDNGLEDRLTAIVAIMTLPLRVMKFIRRELCITE